jgi:hypothetical protein
VTLEPSGSLGRQSLGQVVLPSVAWGALVPAEAERVAHRIEVHPERVAIGLAWLDVVPACSQRQDRWFGHVDVVDGQVDVKLLRPVACGPGGRGVVIRLLEGEALPRPGLEDDSVGLVPVVVELAADQRPVELGECQGVGAVEDDRPHACGWCHGGLLYAAEGRRGVWQPSAL